MWGQRTAGPVGGAHAKESAQAITKCSAGSSVSCSAPGCGGPTSLAGGLADTMPRGGGTHQAPGPQRREEAGDTPRVGALGISTGQAWRTFTGGGLGAWGLPVPTVLCGGPALHGTQDNMCTHMCVTHQCRHLHIHDIHTTHAAGALHVCTHMDSLRSSACVPSKSFGVTGLCWHHMGHSSKTWHWTLVFGYDVGWSVSGPFPPSVLFLFGPLGAWDSPCSIGCSLIGLPALCGWPQPCLSSPPPG